MPVTPKASSRVTVCFRRSWRREGHCLLVLSGICDGSWVVSYGNPQSSQAVRLALQELLFCFQGLFMPFPMFRRGWRGPEVRQSYL